MNDVSAGQNNITLRFMESGDLAAVHEIEQTAFTDPWPVSAFEEQMSGEAWGAVVAESDQTIVGYGCYYLTGPEAHLTNIAVHNDFRRQAVATALLDHILNVAENSRCEYLLLEVRPSNSGAIAFYRRHGFAELYRRPRYYRRPVEDAIIMVRYLPEVDT